MSSESAHERCRICLQKTKFHVSLHKKVPIDEDNILMLEILRYCGKIEVLYNDRKPQNVCSGCIEKAKEAYKFKLMCMQSETTLNTEILNKMIILRDPLEFKKEDDFIEIIDEKICNIKIEEKNLNNADVGSDKGEDSDNSFNDNDNAEQEEHNDCFENSDEQEESNNFIENNDDNVDNAGISEENKHKCPHCDKSFKYRCSLLKHCRRHHVKVMERCRYCGLKGLWTQLRIHMEKVHADRKTSQCPNCDRRFFHQSHLKQHMRTHMDVKSHICDLCGKGFTQAEDLTTHRKTHKEKYKCDKCGNMYQYLSSLRKHEIKHGACNQPFICKLCGKAYTNMNGLRRHEMVHSGERPYPCSFCDKKFRASADQKRHMNTHTRQQLFKCDVCSKEFTRRSALWVHMKTHTGEKTHFCKVCGKGVSEARWLRSHMNLYHPDA